MLIFNSITMSTSQPIKKISLIFLCSQWIICSGLYAQSVLLISANTTVYDNFREDKIAKLKLDEDTWVNYKGRYGDYFKISNFFGKDEYYPRGIIEGYVSINTVLDTASREDYEKYIKTNAQPNSTSNPEIASSTLKKMTNNFLKNTPTLCMLIGTSPKLT